jgi:hypothetical protein
MLAADGPGLDLAARPGYSKWHSLRKMRPRENNLDKLVYI